MDEALTVRQVTLNGSNSSILSGDAAAVRGIVDRLKWWVEQPNIAFVRPDRGLYEQASPPSFPILGAEVLDEDHQEWCIWTN